MRDIKFRAWDYVNKKMHFADIYDLMFVEASWHTWVMPEEEPQNTRGLFYIMQFTGLTDKHGLDIYEGDILEAYHSESEETIIAEVKFKDGTFTIGRYWKDGIHDWHSMEQYNYFDLDKIGNIHENPELLN